MHQMRQSCRQGIFVVCVWVGWTLSALGQPPPAPQEPGCRPVQGTTWQWCPVPEAVCATGERTGFAFNKTEQSKKLLIYFQGGGACWNFETCYSAHLPFRKVMNTSYDEEDFAEEVQSFPLHRPYLIRENARNPFEHYNLVFIPYCTGDLHAGDRVATYEEDEIRKTTHHVGYKNMTHFLDQIQEHFSDAEYVLLFGTSAGGCGAWYNWERVRQQFDSTIRVDILIDSCPLFAKRYMAEGLEETWFEQWGLEQTLPEGCQECREKRDLNELYDYYARTQKQARLGLVSYFELDPAVMTISADSVVGAVEARRFQCGLDTLIKEQFPPDRKNFQYFLVGGVGHVLTGRLRPRGIVPWAEEFKAWIRHMTDGSESWSSLSPRRLIDPCNRIFRRHEGKEGEPESRPPS